MVANYATNIALVDRETNLVTNVIWGMIYQEEEFNTEKQIAVVIDDLAVSIGDSYDGEAFYHEGVKVLSMAEMLAESEAALNDIKAAYAEGVNSI